MSWAFIFLKKMNLGLQEELLTNLYTFFSGLIPVSEWCSMMEITTELALPWRMLRDKLVTLEPGTQMVRYSTTFDKINDSDITVSTIFT